MATVILVVVLGSGAPAGAQKLDLDSCAPEENDFVLSGNSYFPLPVGRTWDLRGEEEEGNVSLRITVLDQTEVVGTVTTRVVEELEWEDTDGDGVIDPDEDLIELSLNYFATTTAGTVCYFGEAVTNYVEGEPDNDLGSWRADDAGAAPGIYMPAAPKPGMKFAQESAPGVAEDRAAIVGSGAVTVPAGRFRDTIRVRETNPLEGGKGHKVYARDVGLISDKPLRLFGYAG